MTDVHHHITFGRLNPVTKGHEAVINQITSDAARDKGGHTVILSRSHDAKKNPLTPEQKLKHAKRAFPKANIEVATKEAPTMLNHASNLHKKGVTHLTVHVGSDRVAEFSKLLNTYNGKEGKHGYYNFKKITIKPVGGERKDDGEGVESASGTAMRKHATSGNLDAFKKMAPSHMSDQHKEDMYHDVRKGMGINEGMASFRAWLNEGVNDPSIFKAVFMAGGPGSGKSFIVGKTALTSFGLKLINSDTDFEHALHKAQMTASPENIYSEKGQQLRNKAKKITASRQRLALGGKLGLVIDGTGKDFEKIAAQKAELEKLGYDTMMLFVNTDVETALLRNKQRERTLPDNTVKSMWKEVQNNLGKFQNLFGNYMLIVDNSVGASGNATMSAYKKVAKWIRKPLHNPVAKQWIKQQRSR
jgi:predicted kinase